MAVESESLDALYREYRAGIEGEPLAKALRRAAVVLFVINTVFIAVDWIVYPEQFGAFLPVRVALDVVLTTIYFWASDRWPLASSYATSFAGAGMLLTVVQGTGGAGSAYYVGLVLLFNGIGVLAPLTAGQAAAMICSIFAVYAVLPVWGGEAVLWNNFSLALFFLGASGFSGVMSCSFFDRMRFADFRQRREIERARDDLKQLDVEKSRFTANVHHELRTPLTLLLAPIEAMLAGDFGAVSSLQRRYLETMHTNGLRLLKLINNLLDLAKIEGKQLEVRRREVQIGRLVREVASGATPLAERKGVVLELLGMEDLPPACVDPEAFEKVLVNLLGNALKFTEAGGRIEIRAEAAAAEGQAESAAEAGGVHLVVADTGLGIPPEQLERIFDRFAQVDGSTTRRHEGTGIGLALVKELVELHGGRIWAESEGVGSGTRFHAVFPRGEADESAEEALLASDEGSGAPDRSMAAMRGEGTGPPADPEAGPDDRLRLAEMQRTVDRSLAASDDDVDELPADRVLPAGAAEVLIVEDNPDMRRLLAFLVGQEYRIRVARNGREGLDAVRDRAPDLILTDVMMPEMSGTELCRAIKQDPGTIGIPVVLVTSKAEREMQIEGLELGADDYVTKPFHPRELMARVRSLVRLRRLQEELAVRNALLESTNEELKSTLAELKEAGAQLVQAERLAAVGELAAGIAHEVNNPLNFARNALTTLRTYVEDVQSVAEKLAAVDWRDASKREAQLSEVEALRDELGFEEVVGALSELVGILTEGLDRTHRLVGDLRDFAASGDGQTGDVDLCRGLRSTLQLVRHMLVQAGIEVRDELPARMAHVEGDARALNQVFLNLLKNAAEALGDDGGTVLVTARQEEGAAIVEIRDDGPGVAPDLRARLFEPFFTTKEAGRGTGLGLSISRRIVSEHGGEIELASVPGEGTTVSVRLPLGGAGDSRSDGAA